MNKNAITTNFIRAWYEYNQGDMTEARCFLFEAMRYFGYMGRSFGFTIEGQILKANYGQVGR